jgi:hypothetical protein
MKAGAGSTGEPKKEFLMDGRLRRRVAGAALLAALAAGTAGGATAQATVTTDLNDFNLTESTSTYGGGTQFHISTGGSQVSYRWLDSPSKPTVISGNSCADWSLYGSSSYGAGNTSYQTLYWGLSGQCFVVRGRTQAGWGSMSLYDGRILR